MTYEEAAAFIADAEKYKISLGLDTERRLLRALGDPQDRFVSIQIAGTNGKGSVLAYLSGILSAAGYTVGAYSSPAVAEDLETIQVGGESIGRFAYAAVVAQVKDAAEEVARVFGAHPTRFELETACAFLYFCHKQCDYAVIETGMGGRLDATNVLSRSVVGVLTSIGMDHMKFLGDTIEKIAAEKAGILKPGMDVVYLRQDPAAERAIRDAAERAGASLFPVDPHAVRVESESWRGQIFSCPGYDRLQLSMAGTAQPQNALLAVRAAEALRERGASISERAIREALFSATRPARFEILRDKPVVIADGAHNPAAVSYLAESLTRYFPGRRIIGIMGVFRDKDYETIVRLMTPVLSHAVAVTPPVAARALPKEELCACFKAHGMAAECAADPESAAKRAVLLAGTDGVVVAFGSFSYMGELRRKLRMAPGPASEQADVRGKRMSRVNKILSHPVYTAAVREIEELEKDRTFCRHGMAHFLAVARLAYIETLERGASIEKEYIYAAALLHDLGRGAQYRTGADHHTAGLPMAKEILASCGFKESETSAILAAIAAHGDPLMEGDPGLAGAIYRADKSSRMCWACSAQELCDWDRKKKNMELSV